MINKEEGFILYEALIALALLTLPFAYFSFDILDYLALKKEATTLVYDLRTVRDMATVKYKPSQFPITVSSAPEMRYNNKTYQIRKRFNSKYTIVKEVTFPASTNISWGTKNISFAPDGTTTDNTTIILTKGRYQFAVVIDVVGRIRLE